MRYTTPITTLAVNSSGERQLEAHHLDDNFAAQDNAIGAITRALFAAGGVAKAGTVTLTGLNLRVQDRVSVTLDTSAALHLVDQTLDLTTLPAGKGTVVMTTDPVTVNRTYTDIVTQENLTDSMSVRLGRLYVMGAGTAGATLDASGYPVAPQNTVPVAHVTRTAGGAVLDEVLNPALVVRGELTADLGDLPDRVTALESRANWTPETLQDLVGAMLPQGTYNDDAGTVSFTFATPRTDEEIQDIVAALIQAGANVTKTYDDAGNVLTISATGGGGTAVAVSGAAPSSPVQGQQWYDTERNYLLTYVGTVWRDAMGTDRTPAPTGPFARYRLNITASGSGYTSIAQIQLRAVAGGPSIASGGSAFASGYLNSQYSTQYAPAKAFDADPASYWAVQGVGIIGYQLGSAQAVVEYAIQGASAPGESPRAWTFQGSNDGSTWTTLDTRAGVTWAANELKVFAVPT